MWQEFEKIMNQAAGDAFSFPDGIDEPNWEGEGAGVQYPESGDEEHDGFHGTLNKHLIDNQLNTMRNQQAQAVTKLVKLVSEFGSVKGEGKTYLPPKLSKQLNGLLEVCKTLLVEIYVTCSHIIVVTGL